MPYFASALMDAKIGAEGRRDLFEWLSRQLAGLKDFTDAIHLLKPVATAMTVSSLFISNVANFRCSCPVIVN